MTAQTEKIKIPVILGPTAAGKSKIALEIAKESGSDIISCDSRQIYKYMDTGTAKPSAEEQAQVKHWLIDIIEPDEEYSAFRFVEDSSSIIKSSDKNGKRVMVCGGTAFYFDSLKNGMGSQVPSDSGFRKQHEFLASRFGTGALYERLKECDPGAAERIHKNDLQRIIRALQVYYQTGIPMSEHNEKLKRPSGMEFHVYVITLPRDMLYRNINERVEKMFEAGLLEEFFSLREKGYDRESPGMRCVGYKELFEFEDNKINLQKAKENIKRNTRRFAKRQLTWFRNRTDYPAIDAALPEQLDKLKKRIEGIT